MELQNKIQIVSEFNVKCILHSDKRNKYECTMDDGSGTENRSTIRQLVDAAAYASGGR